MMQQARMSGPISNSDTQQQTQAGSPLNAMRGDAMTYICSVSDFESPSNHCHVYMKVMYINVLFIFFLIFGDRNWMFMSS